jgi:hypothetical protein
MRCIARILLNALTVLPLVLFLANIVLWVRSYRVSDRFRHLHTAQGPGVGMWTDPGTLWFWYEPRQDHKYDGPTRFHYWAETATEPATAAGHFQIHAERSSILGWELRIPTVYAALMTASMPSIRLSRRYHVWLRRRHGLCPSCGYDLRATPGRCPECGIAHNLANGTSPIMKPDA